jgi:hypothetical protein
MTTIEELQDLVKNLVISQQETDRRFQETDRFLKEVGRQIGGIGEKFGYLVEGLAIPSMEPILRERFKADHVMAYLKVRLPDGRNKEYNVVGYSNGEINTAVVVEIKSKLKSTHIAEMQDTLRTFTAYNPEHKGKKVFGILTTASHVSPELQKEVEQAGILLARITDGIFELVSGVETEAKDFSI